MSKRIQKILSVVIIISLVCTFAATAGNYASVNGDYKINSTYENVDWDKYEQYKTELHCHTTASDGDNPKQDMIERHYELGYDIMAITDHGTVDEGWDTKNANRLVRIGTVIKDGYRPIGNLESSGRTNDGRTYTYSNNIYTQYDKNGYPVRPMLSVPLGNEQNPTSFNNAHVNTWFVDFGNDSLGGTSDYVTPIKTAHEKGGLSVINHPGEYTTARHEGCFEDAYNQKNIHYRYVVNKFANLLKKYDSCLGIDINSKGDKRTRFDRKLWDLLLQKVVPSGRNVYAIATSDAHNLNIVDSGFTTMLMPSLDRTALRSAMENGEFFAGSCYMGSIAEVKAWSEELEAAGKAPELVRQLKENYNTILKEEAEEGEQDTVFRFDKDAAEPKITRVSVNDDENKITINTENAHLVHWVANGEFIATGNTIDLDDYKDKIGSYVRAEVIGDGGVIYTQAFTLEYEGAPEEIKEFFVDLGFIPKFICDGLVDALAFVLKSVGLVDLLYFFCK